MQVRRERTLQALNRAQLRSSYLVDCTSFEVEPTALGDKLRLSEDTTRREPHTSLDEMTMHSS